MASRFDEALRGRLGELAGVGRLRVPDDGRVRAEVERVARELGVEAIDASSNDYLGLGTGGVSRETRVQGTWGFSGALSEREGVGAPGDPQPGAGASRLVHGTRPEHVALERALADWVGLPEALLF